MRILKGFLILLLICSCNTPRAFFDYDQQVDFQRFTSYAVYPDLISGLSELDEKRLLNSLHEALRQEGIPQSSQPDLYINVYSEEFQEASRNSIGVGVGGTGGNVGVGLSGGFPIGGPDTYLSITFDIIDAQNEDLVWQAVVQMKFDLNASPEKRQSMFDKMVAKALEGYPPER